MLTENGLDTYSRESAVVMMGSLQDPEIYYWVRDLTQY